MKLFASASLRTRLIVALLFVGLIPSGLLSWAALVGASFVAGQQEKALKAASAATLDKIDRNLFERYGDVQAFAAHPTLQNRENWYQAGAEKNPIVVAANRYVALYGCYPLTLVVDLSGKVIAVNDRDAKGAAISTSGFYQRSYQNAPWLAAAAHNQFLNGPQGMTGYRRWRRRTASIRVNSAVAGRVPSHSPRPCVTRPERRSRSG